MKQIIFAILFFTGCIISTSCKKGTPATISSQSPLPPPPLQSGNSSVWFWTRDTVWNNIYININNETKILDESWGGNGDPSCYPYGGSMAFNLPSGFYTYKTWRQGRDTIIGSVTVNFGICNSVPIKY